MKLTKCGREMICKTDKNWCYICRYHYNSEFTGDEPKSVLKGTESIRTEEP